MKKWLKLIFVGGVLVSLSTVGMIDVMADDDDDDEYYFEYEGMKISKDDYKKLKKAYKKFEIESKDDEDDHGDTEDGNYYMGNDDEIENVQSASNHYWNIWSRNLHVEKGSLPITQPAMLTFKKDQGIQNEFYAIPTDGELLVPSIEIAEFLGESARLFPNSKIVVIESVDVELIVKSGTNVAYENRIKTPMPAKAMHYQKSIYIPVSVIANGLGYVVEWNEEEGSIYLEKIN